MTEIHSQLMSMLDRESVLGGVRIEGVVVKNYTHKQVGKVVSDSFKETRGTPRPKRVGDDIIAMLGSAYRTEARWAKAEQHLREEGKLTGEMRDIGAIAKEVQRDLFVEESDAIKDALLTWATPQLHKIVVGGLAEWYKMRLMATALPTEPASMEAPAPIELSQ